MATGKSKIIYTLTDEAPLLATCAFLPIVRTFTGPAGIEIEKADISVSARVLAEFGEYLRDEQKVPNTLAELGAKCLLPETNIIKLPNISASVAQLKACVKELQEKGYKIPDYPETADTDEAKALKARFGKCIGSAVNPGIRGLVSALGIDASFTDRTEIWRMAFCWRSIMDSGTSTSAASDRAACKRPTSLDHSAESGTPSGSCSSSSEPSRRARARLSSSVSSLSIRAAARDWSPISRSLKCAGSVMPSA